MLLAEVGREDHRARVALHLLQQVRDLDVRVAVVGVARPRSACRTARRPRRRTGSRWSRSAASKMRSRFFSVSPMYLETTVARSMRKSSRPSSRGEHLRRPSSCRCPTRRRTAPSGPACARPSARSPTRTARGRGGAGRPRSSRAVSRWRSGSTRSSQRKRGVSRDASSPSRDEDALARAEVEVAPARRPRRRAARRGDAARPRPPRRSGVSESRNFAATSSVVGEPVSAAHGLARSASVRHRRLDEQHRAVAEASTAPRAWRASRTMRSGRVVDGAQQLRVRSAGSSRRGPSKHEQPALERAARARRRPSRRRLSSSRTSHEQQRLRRRAASERVGVGAGDHERQLWLGAASSARTLRHRLVAARGSCGRRREAPQAAVARGSSRAPSPSRNAASRSATLAARSASGVVPSPSSSRSAPRRRSGAVALEAGEHVGGRDALAGEQLADQPRARRACA